MSVSINTGKCVVVQKKELGPPQPPENWKRCRAYLERKKRFCKQWPTDGKLYCGNHLHLEKNIASSSFRGGKIVVRKRIPCPIDPSHMIFEHNLKKHILVCPRAKKRKRQEEEPYFLKNVNCGGHGRLVAKPSTSISSSSKSEFEPGTSIWAQRIARRILRAHQSIFKTDKTCDVSAITCRDIHSAIDVKDLSKAEIDAGIREGFLSHHIKSGGNQHTIQIASLIGHIREMGFFERRNQKKNSAAENSKLETDSSDYLSSKKEDPLVILEMGAGRGMFGLTAAGVASASGLNTHFFMVDRAGSRSKAEKAFRTIKKNTDRSYLKLDDVNWCRLCCDVSHVNLPVVLKDDGKYKDAKIVVIAKHLCGMGTDLALKSLIPIRHKIDACIIATCCHGVCSWEHYVGRDILREVMKGKKCDDKDNSIPSFGPLEFDLLRRWSGATVATREGKSGNTRGKIDDINKSSEDSSMEHASALAENEIENSSETNISAVVRKLGLSCSIQGLGRACQRLIDHGRSEYIRQSIFQTNHEGIVVNNLSQYVGPEVTPQNAILWAYRKETPKSEVGR